MVKEITPEVVKRQPPALRYYIYIVTITVLFAVIYVIGALIPYEPFVFYGWEGIPTIKCQGELVDTNFTSEVRPGFYTVEGFTEGYGYWIDETGTPYGNSRIPAGGIPLDPYEKTTIPSIVNRVTPPVAGEWRLGFDGVIEGRMFGFIQTRQEVHLESEQTVTVLDDDHPKCSRQQEET